jgi:hypothetical protein
VVLGSDGWAEGEIQTGRADLQMSVVVKLEIQRERQLTRGRSKKKRKREDQMKRPDAR